MTMRAWRQLIVVSVLWLLATPALAEQVTYNISAPFRIQGENSYIYNFNGSITIDTDSYLLQCQ